ncbi:class I SAM-dependent methyltransferase [bacterium]|nr:class I SAM-dependent methyltransferase [bacterium]
MRIYCPICTERHVAYVSDHLDFPKAHIYFCTNCTHWFSSPEPDSLWLDTYYKETYSCQRRRYFGEKYYAIMQRRAAAHLEFIKQYLGMHRNRRVSLCRWKALDFGCGVGAMVAALQQKGADAIGYDSDPVAIDVGRSRWKANIHVSVSNNWDFLQGMFDLLYLSHFVEHLPDIRYSFSNILQFLRPGGYIFIEVPDCFAKMFENNVDTESHLNFFTRNSMVKLLELLKLQLIVCVSCGPPKMQAYNLDDRLHDLGQPEDSTSTIKTIYDGYYDKYYSDEAFGGMWLRCLARKPGG